MYLPRQSSSFCNLIRLETKCLRNWCYQSPTPPTRQYVVDDDGIEPGVDFGKRWAAASHPISSKMWAMAGTYRQPTTATCRLLYGPIHTRPATFDDSIRFIWSLATQRWRSLTVGAILLALRGDHYQTWFSSGNRRRHGQFWEGDENFGARVCIPTYQQMSIIRAVRN